jgi:hypothetical protein
MRSKSVIEPGLVVRRNDSFGLTDIGRMKDMMLRRTSC